MNSSALNLHAGKKLSADRGATGLRAVACARTVQNYHSRVHCLSVPRSGRLKAENPVKVPKEGSAAVVPARLVRRNMDKDSESNTRRDTCLDEFLSCRELQRIYSSTLHVRP